MTAFQKIKKFVSDYRWPMILSSLIILSITAQGMIVLFATSSEAPMPEKDFYEKSLKWDEVSALTESSKKLGWSVEYSLPEGNQFLPGMARPLDICVKDDAGKPVSGLVGKMFAVRPSETRLNTSGILTELSHKPGNYRTLITFGAYGLWEMALDANYGKQRFVNRTRIDVRSAKPENE